MKATVYLQLHLCLAITLQFLLVSALPAQTPDKSWPILHSQGRTYHNAKLTKIEPDGLRITHDAGAAKILCEDLPAQLLAEFSFDSIAASKFRRQQQQLRVEEEARVQQIKAMLHEQDIETANRVQSIQPRRMDYTSLGETTRLINVLFNYHCGGTRSCYSQPYSSCDSTYLSPGCVPYAHRHHPTLHTHSLHPSACLISR